MSDQAIGRKVIDPKAITGEDKIDQKQLGRLVLCVRLDETSTGEQNRLAKEGEEYPMTVDANGFLRVVLPEGTEVESAELEVQRQSMVLLEQIRDLLMKIA